LVGGTEIAARNAAGTIAAAQPFQWGSLATAQLYASRSWSGGVAYNIRRTASEMAWVSDQYRVSLQLAPIRDAAIQVEGARTRDYPVLAPLSFTPANVAIRTCMPEGAVVAVMQSPATYDDIAAEMVHVDKLDYGPLWSIEDRVLENLVRLVQREIAGPFGDDLLMPVLSRAIATRIARLFAGSDAKLAEIGKLGADRVGRVVDYIDAHLGDPLSLDAIAGVACLSPFHFARCFKSTTGSGLHQFVIRRRIQRAKELIARPDLSLAEIAVSVGFASQAALTSRFTREVGRTPGAYRRAFRDDPSGGGADDAS